MLSGDKKSDNYSLEWLSDTYVQFLSFALLMMTFNSFFKNVVFINLTISFGLIQNSA